MKLLKLIFMSNVLIICSLARGVVCRAATAWRAPPSVPQAALEGGHDDRRARAHQRGLGRLLAGEAMRFIWASWRRRGTTASTSSARARRGRRRPSFTSYRTTASYSRWPCSGGSRSRSSGRSRRARASAEKLQSALRRTLVHGAGLPEVLISGHYGCSTADTFRFSLLHVPRAVSLAC